MLIALTSAPGLCNRLLPRGSFWPQQNSTRAENMHKLYELLFRTGCFEWHSMLRLWGVSFEDIPSGRAPGHYTAFCSWLVGSSIGCSSNKQSRCPTGCFVSAYHRPFLFPHPWTKHRNYFLYTFTLSQWPTTVHFSFTFVCAIVSAVLRPPLKYAAGHTTAPHVFAQLCTCSVIAK